jgi:hypothetical protein
MRMSSSLGSEPIDIELEMSSFPMLPFLHGDKSVGRSIVSATFVARSSASAMGSVLCCGLLARARLRGFAVGAGPSASGFASAFGRDVVFFAIYPYLTSALGPR